MDIIVTEPSEVNDTKNQRYSMLVSEAPASELQDGFAPGRRLKLWNFKVRHYPHR